jgi:hypothetical protein
VTYGIPTDLATLLPAIAAQIVAGTGLAAERVLVTLEPEAELEVDPISDVLVTVAPVRFPIDQPIVTGGGSAGENTLGEIEVIYYNRYEADYTHADVDALTDANSGILANWRLIMKTLQLWAPIDRDGDALSTEPMRLIAWEVPKRTRKSAHLRIRSRWKLEFIQDFS